MIYEWIEANRKDIDILTSFLVTVIPIIMLYSEALGISENTIPYCILMIVLGVASHYASRIRGEGDVEDAKKQANKVLGYPEKRQDTLEDTVIMNKIKKKIVICNFTKTISSAVLTAVAINIIMTNATKYSLLEGLIPFSVAIFLVAIIDIYEYRCEKEDMININELEDRIEKLEREQ